MKASEILFRCHSIGDFMGVKGFGETGKKTARYTFLEYIYGRKKDIDSKYLKKGILCEEASFKLAKSVLNLDLIKNEERKENEFLTGECDTFNDEMVVDFKNSWDVFTFSDSTSKLNTNYEWQLRAYMELYNRDKAQLIYTLVDAPDEMVLEALEKESYKYPERDTPEFIEVELIKQMVFSKNSFERIVNNRGLGGDKLTDLAINSFIEIPEKERIFVYTFLRDASKYNLIIERIKEARIYLASLYPNVITSK
jgi:hypothetical protein